MQYLQDVILASQRSAGYWEHDVGTSPLGASEDVSMATGSATVSDLVVDLIGRRHDPRQTVVIYVDQNPYPAVSRESGTFLAVHGKPKRFYDLFLKSQVLLLEKLTAQYATLVPEVWAFDSEVTHLEERVLPMKLSAEKIFEFRLSMKTKELPSLEHRFFLDPLLD